jgi:hypothetical protein
MLEYAALGILIFVFITLFYGIIAIHDIPYEISKHRNHPHQDAIHVAGWVNIRGRKPFMPRVAQVIDCALNPAGGTALPALSLRTVD